MNNFLYYKTNTNTLSGQVDQITINESSQYKQVDQLPNNPENGLIVYHNNDLKIYNNNQWETIANTSNETFNNLTVTNNLNVYGYNLPKQASLTYKIEKVGGSWFLSLYGANQFNGLDLDISNVSANYRTGIVVLNKSACGINYITDISIKMVYCDNQNTMLQVRPTTLLYSSLIPTPTPAPDVITLNTYVYDQFRVINDLDVDSAGSVFIFAVNIFGYS